MALKVLIIEDGKFILKVMTSKFGEAGAADYIVKSDLDLDDLVTKVRNHVK